MRWISDARPSPAIIVAVVALVAALAGTAAAGPDGSTSAINKKKVKKIAKKQAIKQINALAPGLSVAHANTANSATQAQNASTANRVRPVTVDYAGTSSESTTLFDQGGLRIRAECPASVIGFSIVGTANNGALKLDWVDGDGGTGSATSDLDFDVGDEESFGFTPDPPGNSQTFTIAYRGAGGTTVSGELLVAKGAAAASCVVGGTLLVG